MKYKNWLCSLFQLNNNKKSKLIGMGITAEKLFYIKENELRELSFLSALDIDRIITSRNEYDIDKEWLKIIEKGISLVTIEDSDYPKKLLNIDNCPYGLYYIGKMPSDNEKIIGMVGARNRSAYGCEVAYKLAQKLSENGFSVISGMARGIDSDSHKGALEGDSNTYAVLGSGVDVVYPAQNKYLYNKIINKGAVLSENIPGTKALSIHFPLRNRIITALCDSLIIVEAKEKSGSLISADYAIEQGKDVYVIPGRITDSLSMGCNRLISQGAHIVLSIDDMLEQLNVTGYNNFVQMDFRKKLLEKDEALVYSLLDFRPLGISYLMNETNIQLSILLEILQKLILKGFIKEIVPNYFVKVL